MRLPQAFNRRTVAMALAAMLGGSLAPPALARTIADARDRGVSFGEARRIASIGGAVTETIFALGEQSRIAAVDTTSTFPPETGALPNVGYMRALSAEGVLSVDPDLILALDGSGPPEAIASLERAQVPFLLVPNQFSRQSAAQKIVFIANVLGAERRGSDLIAGIETELDDLTAALADIARKPRVLFILSAADGKLTVAGEASSAAAMIALAGGINAITGFSGYKPASGEALIAAAPEAIVLMKGHVDVAAAKALRDLPALKASPAAEANRIKLMDGTYLLGFGPRIASAARELAGFLHPELELTNG